MEDTRRTVALVVLLVLGTLLNAQQELPVNVEITTMFGNQKNPAAAVIGLVTVLVGYACVPAGAVRSGRGIC